MVASENQGFIRTNSISTGLEAFAFEYKLEFKFEQETADCVLVVIVALVADKGASLARIV